MSLDLDLIRDILLLIENKCSPDNWLNIDDFLQICPDKNMVVEHLHQLKNEGFIDGSSIYADNECAEFMINRMNTKAYDYLNQVRSSTNWENVKKYGIETLKFISLEAARLKIADILKTM